MAANNRRMSGKKGAVVGSGGQRRRGLEGKGPTPPAEMRPGHPAQRKAAAARAHGKKVAGARRRPADGEAPETVLGRNAVVECLRAGVPATALHVAVGSAADERIAEAIGLAADARVAIL